MTLCYFEIDWTWELVLKKVLRLLTFFRWYVWDMSLKLLDHTRRHCCRNWSEKLQQGFKIKGMRSYLLKEQLQLQSTETFCICLWSNNQVLSKFYYLLIFSLQGKSWFGDNLKTVWPRMILEWHLFLRLSLGFVWKMLSFVGKHLSFYPKDVCSFSVFFI